MVVNVFVAGNRVPDGSHRLSGSHGHITLLDVTWLRNEVEFSMAAYPISGS